MGIRAGELINELMKSSQEFLPALIVKKVKKKVKGHDIYILPLTGKPRPAAVYN